jgi:hypothetical protein
MHRLFMPVLLLLSAQLFAQKNVSVSFEKWISLKGLGSPLISPDGKTIDAYPQRRQLWRPLYA